MFDLVASLQLCSIICLTTPYYYYDEDDVRQRRIPNAWVYRTPLKKCACLYYYGEACLNHYGKKRFEWKVANDPGKGIVFQGKTEEETKKIFSMSFTDNTLVINMDVKSVTPVCIDKLIFVGHRILLDTIDGDYKDIKVKSFNGDGNCKKDGEHVKDSSTFGQGLIEYIKASYYASTGGMVGTMMYFCSGDLCEVATQSSGVLLCFYTSCSFTFQRIL